MRRRAIRAALITILCGGGATSALADIVAGSADDVCAPTVDPCVVTERVAVLPDSTLDFGSRGLVVEGDGQLDFGGDSAEVAAGAVKLGGRGVRATAGDRGGFVAVVARRACSGDHSLACRRNAECGLGHCTAGLECSDETSRACATNADCQLGTCNIGVGDLSLTANWDGRAAFTGGVLLSAADGLTVSGSLLLGGTTADSDGGFIGLESTGGDIVVTAPISLNGGGNSAGGLLSMEAGGDILLQSAVDCTGGDQDGGEVAFAAGRDLALAADINCNAVAGSGMGGTIDLAAGRDLRISGGTANNRRRVLSFGNQGSDGFGGDGGDISLVAGRDVVLGKFVSVISAGARPDGYGGDFSIEAGQDLLLEGEIETRADGIAGDGGFLDVLAGGRVVALAGSRISVDGGNVGALDMAAAGNVELGGSLSMTGRQGGLGGGLFVVSDADLAFRGTLSANRPGNTLDFQGCRVVFDAGADANNNSDNGTNVLTARESVQIRAGSFLRTRNNGTNRIVYRDSAKPPVLLGTVSPAPSLEIDATLDGCPVCGNAEIDKGETCDDGNTDDTDDCTADCQLRACVDATIGGYPANPLCYDGNACTVDRCDVGVGACSNVVDCDDGVSCTVDMCSGTECVSTPDHGACSDGNLCNGVELCNPVSGCVSGNPPNCDDDDVCTIDSCEPATGCRNAPSGDPGCVVVLCGDANGNGVIQASDALIALRTAVGTAMCPLERCDVNNNGAVQASDALAILRRAVGQAITLTCPLPT